MKQIKLKQQRNYRTGFEIKQVGALINGIKYIFTRGRIFTDIGMEIK